MTMELEYLKSIRELFEYYKAQGEKSIDQLEEKELFWQPNDGSNSISILVGHLSGNMKSRWTDFLTTDGEKTWRERDREFESTIESKEELLKVWNEGWDCLFNALKSVNQANFQTVVYIRNQAHSIVYAFNRQLAHYASHIGQMVYFAKMIRSSNWKSLSIPKGESDEFNQVKFSKGKHGGNFTEDLK